MHGSHVAVEFAIALLGGAVAVLLGRRELHTAAAGWASGLFGIAAVVAYIQIFRRLPPLIGMPDRVDSEAWEFVVIPFVIACGSWPWIYVSLVHHDRLRLWSAMVLASTLMLCAMPTGEMYSDVVPGNTLWTLTAVFAVGLNTLAGHHMDHAGASRWSLWAFVAQLFTVTALAMTCYGTLGDWCGLIAMTLGVIACSRAILSIGHWAGNLGLLATTLACLMASQLRIYSAHALPMWLAPVPMFLPAIVYAADLLVRRRSPSIRVLLSAVVAVTGAAITILWALRSTQRL